MSTPEKERVGPGMMFVAPAVVVIGWIQEFVLAGIVGVRVMTLALPITGFPLYMVAKTVVLGVSAGFLVYTKPYEANLYVRSEDVLHWRRRKQALGLTCSLVVLECIIRSQRGLPWTRGAGWSENEAWLPLYIFLISLIVLGVTKRLVVFLGRMS